MRIEFRCEPCDATFDERLDLGRHVAANHVDEAAEHPDWWCPQQVAVEKYFTQRSTASAGDWYACKFCVLHFCDRRSAARHLHSEHPDRVLDLTREESCLDVERDSFSYLSNPSR